MTGTADQPATAAGMGSEVCRNSSSLDSGPDATRCALPTEFGVYPPTHNMHSTADGTYGWGNPPPRLRDRCWRGLCLGRERLFVRLPVTDRYGWHWAYEGPCGHRRNR